MNIMQTGGNTTIIAKITKTLIQEVMIMEVQQVLEKNRTMHDMMRRATVDALDMQQAAEQLHSLLQCGVYMIDKDGEVLGMRDSDSMQMFSVAELEEHHCCNDTIAWLFASQKPVYNQACGENYCSVLPVCNQFGQIGVLLCGQDNHVFAEDQQLLMEYGATLVSVMMMRAASRKAETEARKKNVVQLALEVLSYSELEAVKYIFHEINGSEGFLVASKLAEEYKLTRSVIVNALRKLESAGVIDARSLGMKGTYIKILNDYLYEELEPTATL